MKKKILIYDDDKEILLLCKTILAKYDFETEIRAVCDNVLNDIEATNPDLVLMDLWIPGIGGEKAILLLKQNERTKHIPVLVFSADTDIAEISEKVQANGFIEKPFTIPDFIKQIRKHFL